MERSLLPKIIKKIFAASIFAFIMILLMTLQIFAETGFVNTESSGLNVRTGPGLTYSIIKSIPKGTVFNIISESGGWVKISTPEITGYVSADYVGRNPIQTPVFKYPSVILNAPDYKQYDSEWANIKIGIYGSTLRSIGCTVTCVAITESYRTGIRFTPAKVVATHEFTPGGAIYWAWNYTRYYGSDWLAYTYAQLAAGRPVIVHCETRTGVSHWVTVYGYKNNTNANTLSAADFLIRDPASTIRATLADYLAVYPVYIKLANYIN